MKSRDPFAEAVRLHQQGQLTAAIQGYRRVLAQRPHHAGALHYLGVATLQLGDREQARQLMEQAARLAPGEAEIQYNLAGVYNQLGLGEAAVTAYHRALTLHPGYLAAAHNLGNTLFRLGRLTEAMAMFRLILERWPQEGEARRHLSLALLEAGQAGEAWTMLQPLLVQPHVRIHHLAIRIQQALGCLREALAHGEQALRLQPGHVPTLRTLAALYLQLGWPDRALAACEQALASQPDADTGRMQLHALMYLPRLGLQERFQAHRDFESRFVPLPYPARPRVASTDGVVRVGILSSDLREHVVARNLLPVLEHYDPRRLAIHCYAEVAQPDGVSQRLRQLATGWRSTVGLDDRQVAEHIRQDGIQVLLITASRFDRNRPLVFAQRPAPVLLSWHDVATTGLTVVDGLLADAYMVPRKGEEPFTERVLRLPGFFLHPALSDAPDPGPLPMVRNGYPTFGSCNNPAKLNDEVLALWAELLLRLPQARLLLKYRNWLADPLLADRIVQVFLQAGVARERLLLAGGDDPQHRHLGLYHGVDIALDPFPFCGSTTTFEALWMGVPVVTLPGKTMVSRWSGGILRTLNMAAWIADSPADYLRICQQAVAEVEPLARLRQTLRQRVACSPLCDGRRWTRHWQRLMIFLAKTV